MSSAVHAWRFSSRLSLELPDNGAPVVITVVRNEALRLPYFLSYYEALGVGHVVVLDHGSDDDTAAIVDAHPLATRIPVSGDFSYKTSWITSILSKYLQNRWVLVVDADEILVWPDKERLTLRGLIAYMEAKGYDALGGHLLDMFPKGDIGQARYRPGQDPLEVAPYFDPGKTARTKVFDVSPTLTKVPLFRYRPEMVLSNGQHVLSGARMADIRACLLHFKFLQDFKLKNYSTLMLKLVDRDYGRELTAYRKRLQEAPEIELWTEEALTYSGPEDLIAVGLMERSESLGIFLSDTQVAAE